MANRTVLFLAWLCSAATILHAQQPSSSQVDNSRFIYLGNDDIALHLVWEEHPAFSIAWYVVEKSYDGNRFFAVDSVRPQNLFDIHVNNYPKDIEYYNRILYSTETGGGRFIYNDVRDVSEAGERNFWYRVKMIKSNGERIQTKSVVKSFSYGIEDVDRLPGFGHDRGGAGLGEDGPSGEGGQRGATCPDVQAPPAGYIFNGNTRTFYGDCCYWEEREYIAQQITEACGGLQAWCCPRDCAPLAYDPCCVHICSEYNQCSCPPWICCDITDAAVWIVHSSITYTIDASVTNIQNPKCNGNYDGSVTVTNNGGLPPITYSWDNGVITGSAFNNLAAGVYSVTILDGNGCSETESFTLTNPPLLSSSLSIRDVTCFGFNDGSIDVTVSGGTPSYTYTWTGGTSNGATSQDLTGIGPGNYALTITDANSCVNNHFSPIFSPDEFLGVITFVDLGCLDANSAVLELCCFGSNTGSAVLSLSGGTSPNSFIWSNGINADTNSYLIAGTYAVSAVDANGCSFTASATLGEPDEIVPSAVTADAACGQCDGWANISVNGGSGLFNFSWPGGQTTASVSGLCAGSHTVIVSDAFAVNCSKAINVTVSNFGGEVITASHTDVSCAGACNGTASVNFNCTSPPCTVGWFDPIGALLSSNNSVSGLCPGSYSVVVTNSVGCITAETVEILEGTAIAVNLSLTHETCPNACDGAALAATTGGAIPYSFEWQDAGGNPIPLQTDSTIQNLCPGDYLLRVQDFAGCSLTHPFTILPNIFSIAATPSNPLCHGVCDGSIEVDIAGGAGPFTYQWLDSSNNAVAGETNSIILNLCAGTYYVQVTASTSCTLTSPAITLVDPQAITATISTTDIICDGQCTGTASVTASGGAIGYAYQWYNAANIAIPGGTNSGISSLCEGTYFVGLTDSNGCASTHQANISVLITITTIISAEDISCHDADDGSIDLTVNGGTAPLIFSWNNGAYITEDLSNLSEGIYTVLVTDSNGCTATDSAGITNPDSLTAFASAHIYPNGFHVSCTDGTNGRATVTVNGGTAPFTYVWNDGQLTPIAIGLALGTYTVTVIDAQGCMAIGDVTLHLNPPPLLTTLVADTFIGGWNVSCFGASDGFIDLTVINGTPPFVYEWLPDHIVFIEDLDSVSARTYTVYVTDTVNGCSTIDSITLNEPPALSVTSVAVNASCFGGNDGAIDLTVTGGTPGYSYLWTGGMQTSQDINGLIAGIYIVSIADTNGCAAGDTIVISDPVVIPFSNVSIETCRDSFFVGNAYQTVSGIYYDTVQFGPSCDSVIITDLQFVTEFHVTDSVSVCDGSSYYVGGDWQTQAGIYYDTLIALGNCDSIVQTYLSFRSSFFTAVAASICDNEFYFAGGANQNTTGVYFDILIASGGCDSIVETTLIVFPTYEISNVVSICEGDSFFAAEAFQKLPGFYYDTLVTFNGCDSVLETQLIINPNQNGLRMISICEGDSLMAGGEYQNASGTYYDSLATTMGCDSVIATELNVLRSFFFPTQQNICEGDSLFAGGSYQSISGIYYDTLASSGSCDSVIETTLSVIDVEINAQPDSALVQEGNSVLITIISDSSNLTYYWSPTTGLSCTNCDSVTIIPHDDITYTVVAMNGLGCRDTSTILIYVAKDTLDPNSEIAFFYVPNVFSPNGDGINDEFRIFASNYSYFRLLVFDRWGEKLFETNNHLDGWDGTFKGNLLNPGVYVYYVDVSFGTEEIPADYTKYRKGSVTLIR